MLLFSLCRTCFSPYDFVGKPRQQPRRQTSVITNTWIPERPSAFFHTRKRRVLSYFHASFTSSSLRLVSRLVRCSSIPASKLHKRTHMTKRFSLKTGDTSRASKREGIKYKTEVHAQRSQAKNFITVPLGRLLGVSSLYFSIISQRQRSRTSISNRAAITCIKRHSDQTTIRVSVSPFLGGTRKLAIRAHVGYLRRARRVSKRYNKSCRHIR